MCGIAGIVSLCRPLADGAERMTRMVAVQRHRGPDQQGLYLDDHCALGHDRLSIIDLAGGAQPMASADERYWITFNGEIFNYLELREELVARGRRFRTASDTEVLLQAFEEFGPACLGRFNGQFAFAIWDAVEWRLFAARDRMGIRPLFYSQEQGEFRFASEIKALFQHPGARRELDPVSLAQIFTYWACLPGRAPFRGVRELPPGHFLLLDGGGVRIESYWRPPFVAPGQYLTDSPADLAERGLELLADAIRLRLRADVPVACYLSGGLDSSAISALVARRFNSEVHTFGVRFDVEGYDEGDSQGRMVAALGVRHEETLASGARIAEALPQVMWHVETPLTRLGPAPMFMLSGLTRASGFKVALTGEGADEAFCGYNIFRETKVRSWWARRPESRARAALIGKLYPYVFRDERMRRMTEAFFAQGLERPDEALFSHRIRWANTARAQAFLAADARVAADAALGAVAQGAVLDALPAGFGDWDALSRAQWLEMATFLGQYLLSSQGDRVAMAHSLEIRMPFLDHRLVEWAARVPPNVKIPALREKALLRRMLRGELPEEIRRRPKQPYRAPAREALLDPAARDLVDDLLSPAALRRAGHFDDEKVIRLLRKARQSDALGEVDAMALVGVVTTQLVHRLFVEDFKPARAEGLEWAVWEDRRQSAPPVGERAPIASGARA